MAEREWQLPQCEPQECRSRAEELLAVGATVEAVPRAVAWALLAVAGELHEIRRQSQRKR
ncbi:hypothetical protein GCM10023084_05570 [Streptomyces lacrimifluminis]|uniref:Uncharacterized protein n=1 Tax=Streptomyces lacrimifluminis TaxID=1500077 RepID=A0A917KRE6_9ACTN|nr:hypothetical protein [Streptomyces lacrimifluminis]GGJ22954.1 hypothetical protein GCM10012282_19310 [Streptomyces lacrimifluminis]